MADPKPTPRPPRTHSPFGEGDFGRVAERFARFFGTPKFIIGQTVVVAIWIALNAAAFSFRWDPYPFILLNLAFSTQAAYAAPLILLAQTRQADRDKVSAAAFQEHLESEAQRTERYEVQQAKIAEQHAEMLRENTALTKEVARLTAEIQAALRR
jgi:uncharacterized membrane protein